MKNQILNRFFFVVILAGFALVLSLPATFWGQILGDDNTLVQNLSKKQIALGLDLAGGTELDYKIDLSEALAQNQDEEADNDIDLKTLAQSVRDSLEARVNPAGVGEIIVKLAPINDEEHVLIQMPPNTNVEKAKSDAEKNNKLEFFEENPELLIGTRLQIAEYLTKDLTAANWDTQAPKLVELKEGDVEFKTFGPIALSQISDRALAETLENAPAGSLIQEIITTHIEPEFTVDENGALVLDGPLYPQEVLSVVKVGAKTQTENVITLEAEAEARHILLAYPGALRAAEDLPYENREAALAKAEELLAEIQKGTDFATLAIEFSNGPSGKDGGNLGTFKPGTMAPAFNDAVFGVSQPQLITEVVETDFGFHIIEVTDIKAERTENTLEDEVTYEMLMWNTEDLIWDPTPLGGAQLNAARVGYDEIRNPVVELQFDKEGGQMFAELTENVANRSCDNGICRLGIKVGGEFITTPTVREKIVGRTAQITGNFTFQGAQELANSLNLGAIDAPVVLSGQTTIKAELGAEQLQKSIKAALFGFIATILFMIGMYRLPGLIAGLTLLLYAGLFVTLLKIWPTSFGGPIVLTLSGAAGIALSIGLAVDGNILIFERLKEELQKGRKLGEAIDLGFERAWNAIRDSNLTTLLTCFILFALGSSIIKGFAITLIVGTLLSMFTAVTVSRNLLRVLTLIPGLDDPRLWGLKKNDIGKKLDVKVRTRKSKKQS